LCESFPEDEYFLFTQRENDSFLRELYSEFSQISYEKLDFAATNRYSRIIREQIQLPIRVKRAHVDVLWSPGYTAPGFCHCPQVVSILDMQYKRFPEDLSFLARQATDILLRLATWRISKILTISEFSKHEIVDLLHVSPDRVTVSHLAASEVFSDTSYDTLPQSLPEEAVRSGYILCVANTYPHKNVHSLVRAFGAMADNVEQHVVLVGKPRLGEPLLQQALASLPDKVQKRIHRLNRVAFPELVALYRKCSLFVFPSLYEGFGLPVLEAMLAGVPTLGANIPTTQEVGGGAVISVDADRPESFGKQMLACLRESEEDKQKQIKVALEYASRFSWAKTAQVTRDSMVAAVG
jgi:glycosyltransferase involved in cell wall biosynthesis